MADGVGEDHGLRDRRMSDFGFMDEEDVRDLMYEDDVLDYFSAPQIQRFASTDPDDLFHLLTQLVITIALLCKTTPHSVFIESGLAVPFTEEAWAESIAKLENAAAAIHARAEERAKNAGNN